MLTSYSTICADKHRNCILWTTDSHSVYYDCIGEGGPWRKCPSYIAVPNLLSLSMIAMIEQHRDFSFLIVERVQILFTN
jgi:hypothetical protein